MLSCTVCWDIYRETGVNIKYSCEWYCFVYHKKERKYYCMIDKRIECTCESWFFDYIISSAFTAGTEHKFVKVVSACDKCYWKYMNIGKAVLKDQIKFNNFKSKKAYCVYTYSKYQLHKTYGITYAEIDDFIEWIRSYERQ